ncbi:triose-phosphate isomerase [Hutsoniella sourekii]|uniref:triose-phosphate isomerase n=1 Tax=Hutsoniella sourekii TaxID=87650 RepID=UPI0004811C2C|nr:triose-phosphate isomerase [Hutsoniella sourekii]
MEKIEIKKPFFMFNPKSYLYGDELLELALEADKLAKKFPNISVFVTVPFADIYRIYNETESIIVTAQHMDGINPGRGMGHVLPESLYSAGARATFLNHAERSMKSSDIVRAISRANELGIISILCADSLAEAKALASLNPDIMLCEPTDLIGTGKTSDENYVKQTNDAVKKISPNTLMMQAAGISTADDVKKVIELGADGTGCTSGITEAENPKKMLADMINALIK